MLVTAPLPFGIVILSRREHRQAEMARELAPLDDPDQRLRFFVGDVRDRDRLRRAMEGIEVVIHAAALKRIEVGAYNPLEVKKTNIDGAANAARSPPVAQRHLHGVRQRRSSQRTGGLAGVRRRY